MMLVRYFIRRFLNLLVKASRFAGFRNMLWARLVLRAYTSSPSAGLSSLDRKLVELLGHSKGFYVELGANDGLQQSNTLILEIFHGWKGVLIEPAPQTFRRLQKTRNRARNTLIHAACVSFDYADPSVELAFADLMTTPLGLETDIADPIAHATSGLESFAGDGRLRFVSAPAMTLTAILANSNAPKKISLLSLDVEGAEVEVLKGIDFSKYFFHNIVVEARDFNSVETYMRSHGYVMQSKLSRHDYLFQFSSDIGNSRGKSK
jgi:FkbM family methyltransferase